MIRISQTIFLLTLWVVSAKVRAAPGDAPFVFFAPATGSMALVENKIATALVVDAADWPGVRRAVEDLKTDVKRVSTVKPAVSNVVPVGQKNIVIIGTLGRSLLIDELVRDGKLDTTEIAGRWEAFLLQVVENPLPGVDRALVIAGSDKRGTIYGVYELSEQIGVSPWYWWADVPVMHRDALYVQPMRRLETGPAIKYRGIFLNDEAPALTGWAKEKFGGLNSAFYAKVFELLLRLRGNYLWPAMWGNAFNEDDPTNARLADEYGIVMGTSHHEPMLRAQQEWKRHGSGPWNYSTNGEVLRQFWAEGIRRNRDFESLVTIGMRGDGDEPMSEESNVALLERIVADQRAILTRETGREITAVPQIWALYKEVQDYYERGMRVPDDVTLLWCDDNWGNIRRLPTPAERTRTGGAGVYYHFDYVGGPRNYKWLNTSPIAKTWEQMHLAWRYGADRVWIVNVGDLKPMEFPVEFFLRYAWAPDRWPHERLEEFGRLWAAREFGPEHAVEIAELVATYTKFNGCRKPELLAPDTFSLINYNEAERVVADWRKLLSRAERINALLPAKARDAFFQLVLWPIKACAIVNELYVTAGRNRLFSVQGRASTNALADRVEELFKADENLTRTYNEELAGGKWRHFADQTHIGYTYWQQPVCNIMPAITKVQLPELAALGVAVEGSSRAWSVGEVKPSLPPLDPYSATTRSIEVFNRGRVPFTFEVEASEPWAVVTPARGKVTTEQRLSVTVDWALVPIGEHRVKISINAPQLGTVAVVELPVRRPADALAASFAGFVESDGYVAIEAAHWTRIVGGDVTWQNIAGFGRTLSGVTPFPVDAPSRQPSADSSRLEYDIHLFSTGEAKVQLVVAPTLGYTPGRGLRCAVSIDDELPVVVDLLADSSLQAWERAVSDSAREVIAAKFKISRPGQHVLKFWMVDPGVVLERIVLDLGGVRPSYLGPPESTRFAPRL